MNIQNGTLSDYEKIEALDEIYHRGAEKIATLKSEAESRAKEITKLKKYYYKKVEIPFF